MATAITTLSSKTAPKETDGKAGESEMNRQIVFTWRWSQTNCAPVSKYSARG